MRKQQTINGFTLIELMIALVLGLLLLGGVLGIFLANQTTNRINLVLSDIQGNTRLAFQLMAKDIRSAGFIGCSNAVRVSNVLTGPGVAAWGTWDGGLLGLSSPGAINGLTPTGGTEALRIMYASDISNTVTSHNLTAQQFTLTGASVLRTGDIGVVCDDTQSSIFQVSGTGVNTVNHAATTLNCTSNLGFQAPFACTPPPRQYAANAMLMRFESVAWFVAPSLDDASVNSLYRAALVGGNQVNEEVLFGISGLRFSYMLSNNFGVLVNAAAVPDWREVVAVDVTLDIDSNLLQNLQIANEIQNINFLVSLRNR